MDHEDVKDLLAMRQRDLQLQKLNQLARQHAEADAEQKAMAECPFCGGRIPVGFAKCKNCASDLIWYRGTPGKPGHEIALQQNVLRMEQEAASQQKAAQELAVKKAEAKNIGGPITLGVILISTFVILWLLAWLGWI